MDGSMPRHRRVQFGVHGRNMDEGADAATFPA